MPFVVGPNMQQIGMGLGLLGSSFGLICNAVGNGCQQALAKVTYTSMLLAGTGPGAPVSEVGTGLVVLPGTIAPLILANAASGFGGGGPGLAQVAQAAELAVIQAATQIAILGAVPGVSVGTSKITAVTLVDADWGSAIQLAGIALGMGGSDWPSLASAIGGGIAAGIKLAGLGPLPILVVTGVPAGTQAPVTGLPGSGVFS